MKVYVSTERHCYRTPKGVFAEGAESYEFFTRYLHEFDEVVVVARVEHVAEPPTSSHRRADGDGVRFLDLPDFGGAREMVRVWPAALARLWPALRDPDGAFVLRVPGAVGAVTWAALRLARRPFGLEVVTDPAEAYVANAFGSWMATPLRLGSLGVLKNQVAGASCVAYVTREELQRRYPPRTAEVFSYSSIDLDDEVFTRADEVIARIRQQPDVLAPAELVFVGNLGRPFKGLDVLIDAMACLRDEVPEPHLTVIGDGRLRPTYEQTVGRLGLAGLVRFAGHLSGGEAVYDALVRSDILVLPSRREGLPRVVIEAMAVGLPCVSTDVSGARELLPARHIVPKDDPAALAHAIARLVRSRDLRLEAAERNSERATHFARSHLQPERNRFYRALIRETERCAS